MGATGSWRLVAVGAWGIPLSPVLWAARGVGARANVDSRVCAHGLRIEVGLGLVAAAVAGHAADEPWRRSGPVGGGLWACGAGFERWRDEVRRALSVARSAMKVVAVASVTVGGRRARRCCLGAWDGWG